MTSHRPLHTLGWVIQLGLAFVAAGCGSTAGPAGSDSTVLADAEPGDDSPEAAFDAGNNAETSTLAESGTDEGLSEAALEAGEGGSDAGDGGSSCIGFDVRSYGAVGDGVADDTVALRAAVGAASASAGTVCIPAGTFRLTGEIRLDKTVIVRGAGKDATTITVAPADFSKFSFGYMFHGYASNHVVISDMTLDGQRRNGMDPPNECGGIGLDHTTGWRIERVHVHDTNYFGIFPAHTIDTVIVDGESSLSGVCDRIGGGDNTNLLIERQHWHADIGGNSFDNVLGSATIRDCLDEAPNSSRGSAWYLEGMTNTTIENNRLVGGRGIVSKTDYGYSWVTSAVNPLNVSIRSNYVHGGAIVVNFTDVNGACTKGGNVSVSENFVEDSDHFGVWWGIENATRSTGNGVVQRNVFLNANASNSTTYGAERIPTSGINLVQGFGTHTVDNVVVDTRSRPQQRYGVAVGFALNTSSSGVVVTDNEIAGYVLGPFAQSGSPSTVFQNNSLAYDPNGIAHVNAAAPGSGQIQQNQTGATLILFQKAWRVSVSSPGSISAALGTSNPPPAAFTQPIAPGASATHPDVVILKVPARSYYSFTANAAVLGTATLIKE